MNKLEKFTDEELLTEILARNEMRKHIKDNELESIDMRNMLDESKLTYSEIIKYMRLLQDNNK